MGFAVQPDALGKYATLVERNGINLSLTNGHLVTETKLGNTDGVWLQHLVDAHADGGAYVEQRLSGMAEVWPKVAAFAGKPLDGVEVTERMKAAADGPVCRSVPGLR